MDKKKDSVNNNNIKIKEKEKVKEKGNKINAEKVKEIETDKKIPEVENDNLNPNSSGKEKEKRSFRKDSKGISKRLVSLFYLEKKIDSWKIAYDFNSIFDIQALHFFTNFWTKLKNTRKHYLLVFLLSLTNKNIIELNKNNDFKKFLDMIDKESNNPKMGLDRNFVSNILSILYNKLSIIMKNDKKEKEYKPFNYNFSKIKNADFKILCNSPIYKYTNHERRDEIKISSNIKWKKDHQLPSVNETLKNINMEQKNKFLRRKSIFEPTSIKETGMKEAPSFLRSRHNFAGKNTFVNKSISIPKISGSMLASNQPKKLVILKENEVKKLKEEEKLRQLELKEEKKRKRQSKRSSSRKRKSKNRTDNGQSDVSNSDIDYKSNKEE